MLKKKSKKIAKVILGMFMVVFIGMQITSGVKAATEDETPTEIYYKGYNITYGGEKGILHTKKTWYTGIFFKTKHREYYYLKNSYMRCLTYYCNWTYNQGGKLTISENKSVSRSVVEGVERELGIEGAVAYKVNRNYEDTVTTDYGVSVGLEYDLSKFKHKSYRIAAMGYYDRFIVDKWEGMYYKYTYEVYAYDANFGQEIRLVYRY